MPASEHYAKSQTLKAQAEGVACARKQAEKAYRRSPKGKKLTRLKDYQNATTRLLKIEAEIARLK